MSVEEPDEPPARWCSTCGARPGEGCVSVQARIPTQKPHAGRTPKPRSPRASDIPPRVRSAVRARSNGRCEADWGEGRCTRRAQHQHHRWRASTGGPSTVENLLALCHACHDAAHGFRSTEAYEAGILLHPAPTSTPRASRVGSGHDA